MGKVVVGNKIRILGFVTDSDGTLPISEKNLIGKEGAVTHIDDLGHIKGTWGSLRLLPEDSFEIVEEAP